MKRLRQILYESLMSTSRFPRWWILAFVQAGLLYLIGEFLQPHYWYRSPVFLWWPIIAVFIMAPISAWLWLDIEAVKLKIVRQYFTKIFIGTCLTSTAIMLCSLVLMIAAKLVYPDWLFSALFSSLILATSTLAVLYVVLCDQPFDRAIMLALDTWSKKISLAALVAFVLLISHGVSFALVHGTLKNFRDIRGFSVLAGSATIWILFLASALLIGFIVAFINCFLVLIFLELIRRKKDPEAEKVPIGELITSEAGS